MCVILGASFMMTPLEAQVTHSMKSEDVPLVEIGAGLSYFNVPHYPGSDQSRAYTVPFPTAIYRGDIFRADEDGGPRSRLFKTDRLEFALSFGGALPIKSSRNEARAGMPDLPLILEVGPGITWTLKRPSEDYPSKIALVLPIRQGVGYARGRWSQQGQVFHPMIYGIFENLFQTDLILFTSFSASFSTRQQMDTFYGVAPEYAQDGRQSYEPRAGMLASHLTLGFSHPIGRKMSLFLVGVGSSYRANPNRQSDLLRKNETLALGGGLIWWLWESKARGVR